MICIKKRVFSLLNSPKKNRSPAASAAKAHVYQARNPDCCASSLSTSRMICITEAPETFNKLKGMLPGGEDKSVVVKKGKNFILLESHEEEELREHGLSVSENLLSQKIYLETSLINQANFHKVKNYRFTIFIKQQVM